MRRNLSWGISLAIVGLVLACFSVVSAAAGAEPPVSNSPDDAYLKRILAAASFESLDAEAAEIFKSHKQELLAPLIPYLRTFDGKEYPQLELRIKGGPVQRPEGTGLFEFWINVWAALRPREEGKAPGGGKPSLDSLRGWVEWDPKQNVVKRINLSGQYRALAPEVLDKALRIAQNSDKRYTRQALDDVHTPRWEPAWLAGLSRTIELAKAPKPDPSKPHLIVLVFRFLADAKSIHAVPMETVRVNLQTEKIVSVQPVLVDMGPIYEKRTSPHK